MERFSAACGSVGAAAVRVAGTRRRAGNAERAEDGSIFRIFRGGGG